MFINHSDNTTQTWEDFHILQLLTNFPPGDYGNDYYC